MASSKSFSLAKDVDYRELRFGIYKLQNLKNIDPLKLKKVVEAKKKYRKTITLSDKEQEILDKYGKASGLYLNYVLMDDENETC
jgi:hypothetical protein